MKETHYKLKHRVTALFAAAVMLCSMLPGAAFAEEPTPQPTEETVQMEQQTEPSETDNGQTDESSPDPGEDVTEATSETAEEQPAEEEISAAVVGAELYTDLPDAPIGSYIGSEGLPVATGETKIGISEWPESQLEETSDSYLTAAALDNDGLTMAAPLLDGADYAIVPILAQVEYPADGSSLDLILPDGVTLLDYYGAPVENTESLLHNEYSETSAAVMGVYVQADADFTAQLVYTAPDGSTLTKTLQVAIDRNATAEYPFPDSEITALAERPTPAVTSGKITKVAKVNGTWLIWFNGEPAYCCTPGADGQPKNCPTYTYALLVQYEPNADSNEILQKMIPIGLDSTHGYRYAEKNMMYETFYGLDALVSFLCFYIGLVFLLICAALLALKQLTETTDNVYRYGLLQKLGAGRRQIDHTLFVQTVVFFAIPLVVAGVYSAFLIGKAMAVVEEFMNIHIATNIGLTIVLFLLVYGSYFLATYLSCKRIVTEQRELEV